MSTSGSRAYSHSFSQSGEGLRRQAIENASKGTESSESRQRSRPAYNLSRDHSSPRTPSPEAGDPDLTLQVSCEDTPFNSSSAGRMQGFRTVEATQVVLNDELDGTWVNGSDHFVDAFLENPAIDLEIERALSLQSGQAHRAIDDFLESSSAYSEGRWVDVPKDPIKEDTALYNAHVNNMNEIFRYFGISDCTRAVDSHKTHMRHSQDIPDGTNLSSKPDMVLLGCGSSVSSTKSFPEKLIPTYSQCKAVIEGKLESSISPAANRVQLAVYARECFIQCHNRRFVYGLLLTEESVQIFKFDRAGAMYSSWINIHARPEAFVRIVIGIGLRDERQLGYDTSIFWKGNTRFIQTKVATGATVDYQIEGDVPFFFRKAIRGRGTVCWKVTVDGKSFVVKDSWRATDRTPEWELLELAKGLDGVGQIVAYDVDIQENVSETRFGLPLLSDCRRPEPLSDRTFCRVVLKCYGRPIDKFHTRKELLCAFRDAVAGHRNLWRKGILHRDVSIRNILLGQPDTTANRGLLIDADLAMLLERQRSNADSDFRTGTRAFQSITVLKGEWNHDHLDDLESFFYVLCWICFSYQAAGVAKALPEFLLHWEAAEDAVASGMKTAFLLDRLKEPVPEWFGSVFRDLLSGLHSFCKVRYIAKSSALDAVRECYHPRAVHSGARPLGFSADDDYVEYLGMIDRAIQQLGDDPDDPIPLHPQVKSSTRTTTRAAIPGHHPTSESSTTSKKSKKRLSQDDHEYRGSTSRPQKKTRSNPRRGTIQPSYDESEEGEADQE